jgi:integrase
MARERKLDIHDQDRQLTGVLKRIESDKGISKTNKATILEFYHRLLSENLSTARVVYYLNRLSIIAKWIKKDLDKASKPDIEQIMRRVNAMDYTEWTKKDYRVTLKKFYKWLRGYDERGQYPPEVSWINTHISIDEQDLPNNMPTEEDAKRMIEAAEHPRDKALIASLYESGCRVGEIATLRIGHINFDEYGAHIVVNGKTGSRRIRLVFSAPILASWINVHPQKANPDAPLWVAVGTTKNITSEDKGQGKTYARHYGPELKYRAIASMLKRVANKAGLKKKVNPHIWRHARATFLANKLTEQQLKHLFRWKQSSTMAATYVHLSGRDVDDALLAVYGKKTIDHKDKRSELAPIDCPRCKETNEYNNVFCKKCGWVLDSDAAEELSRKRKKADEIISALTKDPESLKLIANAMAKLGLVDKLSGI